MARGKSPSIDGLTTEVFQRCWHIIEDPYFEMIQQFWESRTFFPQFNEGILKLLPKKADKRRIQDWRPVAMLSTTYKIIAKLIGLQLHLLLPRLISNLQTGFIPCRQIL